MTPRHAMLALALALGCGRSGQSRRETPSAPADAGLPAKTSWGERPIAWVGAGVVTAERLQRRLRQEKLAAAQANRPARDARALLDTLIEEELLVQQAVLDGLLAGDDDARDRLVQRMMTRRKLDEKPPNPTPEQLRAYHDAHRDRFPDEERLRVRHLLLRLDPDAPEARVAEVKKKAERLHTEAARAPDEFAELARRASEDASAAQGGDLGFLPTARWTVLFGNDFIPAVTGLASGSVGPLVRSRLGFHVFQLVDRRATGADPLEVQRREILAAFLEEARAARRGDLLESIRKTIPVKIDERTEQP